MKIVCMVQCSKTRQDDKENRKVVVITYFLRFALFHHVVVYMQTACIFYGFVVTASMPECSVIQVTPCSTSSHFANAAEIS